MPALPFTKPNPGREDRLGPPQLTIGGLGQSSLPLEYRVGLGALPTRLQKSQTRQKIIHLLDAIFVVFFSIAGGPAPVKKAMLPGWVNVKIATTAGVLDSLLEGDACSHRDEIIVVAQEE